MNLDDFDAVPALQESITPAPEPTREELEFEQTDKFRSYRSMRNLILSPEVAKALADGWSYQEIADVLGVSVATVGKYARSEDMSVLLERESRRLIRHLAHRKLKDEKYRDLVLSLGVIVDKARLLRNEPTEITRNETVTVDRLEILLFGPSQPEGGGGEGNPVIDVTPVEGSGSVPLLPEQSESAGSEAGSGDPSGCDEPGSGQ